MTTNNNNDWQATKAMKRQQTMTNSTNTETGDELDKIIFPDHCSSCHSEWDEGYGYGEEPCCNKAASNIRRDVLKWHESQLVSELRALLDVAKVDGLDMGDPRDKYVSAQQILEAIAKYTPTSEKKRSENE